MTMRPGLAATALAVLTSVAVIAQQSTPLPSGAPGQITPPRSPESPSQGTSDSSATIRGRVLRADNNRPLEGVRVRVTTGAVAFTDAEGRYELKGIPAGGLEIYASHSGFIGMYYGQRRPRDPQRGMQVTAGQLLERIDFALPRGGVIAGRVIDASGAPVEFASVSLLRERFINGERRLVDADNEGTVNSRDVTDDLGEFRLYGIAAGTYYLAASPAARIGVESSRWSVRTDATLMTLFPGTRARASARPVTIADGEEIDGIAITLLPTSLATIRATVAMPAGASSSVSLIVIKQAPVGLETAESVGFGNGAFVIPRLPPGRYILFARSNPYFAIERVTLDGEDRSVTLAMKAGRTVSGRVTVDGATPTGLTVANVTLVARSTMTYSYIPNSVAPRGALSADWTFRIENVQGPSRLTAQVPTGWAIKQVVRRGTDITAAVFDLSDDLTDVEVVLTQRLTTVSGVVRDASGQPTNAAALLVFADDPGKWGVLELDARRNGGRYVRRVTPARDGRVNISGLPEGSYVAAAVEALDGGEDLDPELLQRLLSIGTRFTLNEGETRAIDLKVTALP